MASPPSLVKAATDLAAALALSLAIDVASGRLGPGIVVEMYRRRLR
ncbi:hypothetical protein [Thermoproteus uzoniensis]|nr:hypothetical protein [Thermoproteus uzoniensis]